MAVGLVLAAAQERDGFPARAASEGVDGLGADLPPVAPDVVPPRESGALEREEQVARGGDVAVPFVDAVAPDAAGPEAHDEDAGAVARVGRIVDPFDFEHLFH